MLTMSHLIKLPQSLSGRFTLSTEQCAQSAQSLFLPHLRKLRTEAGQFNLFAPAIIVSHFFDICSSLCMEKVLGTPNKQLAAAAHASAKEAVQIVIDALLAEGNSLDDVMNMLG